MTGTFRGFRMKENLDLETNIRHCIAWTVKDHKPTAVHLNPAVVTGEAIDGLPIIPDRYIQPGDIFIAFEKE